MKISLIYDGTRPKKFILNVDGKEEIKQTISHSEWTEGNKLDEYIKILKDKFPEFQYVNVIKENIYGLEDEFTILVRGVPAERTKEFRSFIHNAVYDKCFDNDEELPCIITLQKRRVDK